MRERTIEQKLVTETRKRGGMALKFVSPSYSGMPDRLVLMPNGKIIFVEVKAPGQRPRPLQVSRHAKLRRMGFKVYVLDSVKNIAAMLDEITHTRDGKGSDAG